jgi:mRNA interferase RelE/StbE
MWKIFYHPKVQEDLVSLGTYEARRVLKIIKERVEEGEPDKAGKPLSGTLYGYRRIRTGDIRIIYKINIDLVEVYVLAIGPRRDEEIYDAALKRSTI